MHRLVLASAVSFALLATLHCGGDSSPPPALGTPDAGGVSDAAVDAAPPQPDAMADASPDASEAGLGAATVSPTDLKFGAMNDGLVDCGSQALPKTVTLTNNGSASFTFTVSLTAGMTYYTFSPANGTLPPGASQPIQVIPSPIPSTSSVTPDLYQGSLLITTTATGDAAHVVALHQTARGAILRSTVGGMNVAFGGVAIGQMASSQFSVTNDGNVPTQITLTTGSAAFAVTSPFNVTPSQSVAPTITFSPTMVQPYTDTLILSAPSGTKLCSPLPANTTITGTGTTAVSLNPTNLNFGIIQCGQAAAAAQTTTIRNTGPLMHWTPSFGKGVNSPYALTDMSNVPIVAGNQYTLAASSMVTINVVPKRIVAPASTAADAFADTLTITTDSPMDTPHNVSLHETAQGAVLVLAPTSIQNTAARGLSLFTPFQVQNTGTLPASWTIGVTKTSTFGGSFAINLSSGMLAGGTSANGTLTSTASSTQGEQTIGYIRLTPDTAAVMCSDPPPDMPISVLAQ
jgi:Abnormal spindle-like microcephaly-assoc'd, ASPM-SPD-2-Hydin